MRTANQAFIRQKQGINDAFLFIFIGKDDENKTVYFDLNQYGFFYFDLIIINDFRESDISDYPEEVNTEISRWLRKNHARSIAYLGKTVYDDLDLDLVWWTGIENNEVEESDLWSFSVNEFANLLPSSYAESASTWLAVLAKAMAISEPEHDLECNNNSVLAATLCEWIHGFEAASGDSFYEFDPDTAIKLLKIDDFFLGYEANHHNDDLEELLEEVEYESIKSHVLKQLTESKRYKLRNGLSGFFGSDAGLFWALYSSIWPRYEKPMYELCNELLSPSTYSDMGEIFYAWQFIHDGWCDMADN